MKLAANLDCAQWELLNAILQNLPSAPSTPKLGQIYLNSGDNKVYYWNGTGWADLTASGGGYTHPAATNGAYNPTLSGANVLATFTTDAEGHVDQLSTRLLTLADLGYTGATDANNYVHPTDGVDLGAALTGAVVISDVTVNAEGHVTGFATRSLTAADIGAAIINDALTSGTAETWSIDKIKAEIAAVASGGTNLIGNYDASTNTPDLDTSPSGISKGDMYVVSVDGVFFTEQMRAGDVLIAKQDNPTTLDHWIRAEKNQDIQPATEALAGLARFATEAEVLAGAINNAAVSPVHLQTKLDNLNLVKRFYQTFGDGVSTTFTFTHNFNTKNVVVMLKEGDGQIFADVSTPTVNTVQVSVGAAPASNANNITILA